MDFIALRILNGVIYLYSSESRQAIIQSRHDPAGNLELRYLPLDNFEPAQFAAGFPLRLWEDKNLDVPEEKRAEWSSSWRSAEGEA